MAVPASSVLAKSGLGTRCPEAQADGVPCSELGLDCEICGRPALVHLVTCPPWPVPRPAWVRPPHLPERPHA